MSMSNPVPARASTLSNGEYHEAGANIIDDVRELYADSDVIFKVRPPERRTKQTCFAKAAG